MADHKGTWAEAAVEWKWCKYMGESDFTVQRITTTDYAKFPTQYAAQAFIAERKREPAPTPAIGDKGE